MMILRILRLDSGFPESGLKEGSGLPCRLHTKLYSPFSRGLQPYIVMKFNLKEAIPSSMSADNNNSWATDSRAVLLKVG